MKKMIALALAALMSAVLFAGCSNGGSSDDWKDGTYRASYKNAHYGWTEYLEVTVKDGKITEADFDGLNEEGTRKSEDEAYEQSMKDGGSDVGPMEFYAMYEQKLLDKQNAKDVDAVATATSSGDSLKELFAALEKNMAKGDTKEVIVDNAE